MDNLEGSLFIDSSESKPKPYGFYPYSYARMTWEYIMFFLSLFVFWEIPFEIFLNLDRSNFLYCVPALFIDVCFFIDIYVTQHTGILQEGVIKLDKATILDNIPTWRRFVLWISPWPYYIIGWFLHSDTIYCMLLFFKCFRFVRLYDSLYVIGNTLVYINPVSKMARLFAVFLTVVHICATAFWYTGHCEIPNKSWLLEAKIAHKPIIIQYFHTVYFITTTMLTIGYGDLHPVTFPEVCVVVCVEAFGVFCYQFVVSNFVSIVANPSRNSFISRYSRIYSAFKSRNVSAEALSELLVYYEYVWERDRDNTNFYETASKMPEGLQKKLALELHYNLLSKVNALRGASHDVLERISIVLRPKIFTPGDYLVKAGKVSNRMYFINEGRVSIVSPNGVTLSRVDGVTGAVLGETSMINKTEEINSAIALTYVEAFELLKEDFDDIIELHPQLQDRLAKQTSNIVLPLFHSLN